MVDGWTRAMGQYVYWLLHVTEEKTNLMGEDISITTMDMN